MSELSDFIDGLYDWLVKAHGASSKEDDSIKSLDLRSLQQEFGIKADIEVVKINRSDLKGLGFVDPDIKDNKLVVDHPEGERDFTTRIVEKGERQYQINLNGLLICNNGKFNLLRFKVEKRLRYDLLFQAHVSNNMWSKRRQKGYPWKMDVFDFIEEVYSPWLDKGLLQSDIRHLNPKLYSRMHKQLSLMSDEEREATLDRIKIPKERSEEALKLIADPFERASVSAIRRYHRETKAKQRQRLKQASGPVLD